ncbi:MAG: DUF1697 domain-containing protein [Hyphomicrobiales bacterium]|nr:DUF1697 domain-containing protein [Hyphomicrobiales bacterium]
MPVFIALLRAVNVGGTGKLPMADLRRLCEAAGFRAARTVGASGNVVAERDGAEAEAKAALETELRACAGKQVGVLMRMGAEMAAVLANNPFPAAAPNRTVAVFVDTRLAPDALTGAAEPENLSEPQFTVSGQVRASVPRRRCPFDPCRSPPEAPLRGSVPRSVLPPSRSGPCAFDASGAVDCAGGR